MANQPNDFELGLTHRHLLQRAEAITGIPWPQLLTELLEIGNILEHRAYPRTHNWFIADEQRAADAGTGPKTVGELDRAYRQQLNRIMRETVFGSSEPTIAGFRKYLRSLRRKRALSWEEKKNIVKTVNYWTHALGVQLVYEEMPQTLRVTRSDSEAKFQLRSDWSDLVTVYGWTEFPPISVRRNPDLRLA